MTFVWSVNKALYWGQVLRWLFVDFVVTSRFEVTRHKPLALYTLLQVQQPILCFLPHLKSSMDVETVCVWLPSNSLISLGAPCKRLDLLICSSRDVINACSWVSADMSFGIEFCCCTSDSVWIWGSNIKSGSYFWSWRYISVTPCFTNSVSEVIVVVWLWRIVNAWEICLEIPWFDSKFLCTSCLVLEISSNIAEAFRSNEAKELLRIWS